MLTIHNWQAFESNAAKRRPERGMTWYCVKANLNTRGRLALTRHGIKGLAAIAGLRGALSTRQVCHWSNAEPLFGAMARRFQLKI